MGIRPKKPFPFDRRSEIDLIPAGEKQDMTQKISGFVRQVAA